MNKSRVDPEIMQKRPEEAASDEELARWLEDDLFKPALQARKPYEKPALMSLLFWAGNQWQAVEEDICRNWARRAIDMGQDDVMRVVDNRIATSARTVVAGCTGAMPSFIAVPTTLDREDVHAARLATRALKWRDREDREGVKRREEVQWLYGTGDVLRRTWFDPDGGRPGLGEGDIDTEVINLFRYVIDPMSDPAEWPPKWLIEFDAMPIDLVKTLYPGEATKDLEPEDSADLMRYLDRLALNVMFDRTATRERPRTSVIVKRVYFRPTDRYPNGRNIVYAAGAILDDHELQGGRWLHSRSRWYPIPGRLYGMGTVELLLSDQTRLNIIKTAIHKVIRAQVRGDMVKQGTGKVTEQVGPGGAKLICIPRDVTKWDWMRYDLNLEQAKIASEELIANIKEKGGTRDPVLGNTVRKEVTAYELAISREADLGTQAWHMQMYAEQMQVDICEIKLHLMRQFYKNQRMISGLGRQAAADSPYFYGADLRETSDVEAIPSPHLSPADRANVKRQAAEQGLLGPYPDGPAQQVSCRLQLRAMGLDEEEEQCAAMYGPLEDAMVAAGEIQRLNDALLAANLAAQLRQAAGAVAGPPPTGLGAEPPPAEVTPHPGPLPPEAPEPESAQPAIDEEALMSALGQPSGELAPAPAL